MTIPLEIGLLLAAWTVLPLPLAVAVGRLLAAEAAALQVSPAPAAVSPGGRLTLV